MKKIAIRIQQVDVLSCFLRFVVLEDVCETPVAG